MLTGECSSGCKSLWEHSTTAVVVVSVAKPDPTALVVVKLDQDFDFQPQLYI